MDYRCWLAWVVTLSFTCWNLQAQEEKKAPSLDSTLRQLEKDIASARGLEFKKPVVAKIIPRPIGAPTKTQGYYSLKDKTLFVYDDLKGNYQRGVLIHEMVHALQDQHFSLKKLHQETFGSEAELAMAALIEGDATYTMIEVLKKEQPKAAAMLDFPLEKAKDLRTAFLYSQGARYVKARKDKGGWASVNAAYRFPPRTSAAILHPAGVSTIDLGPGETRGEFALLQKLLEQPETRPLAVAAAAGWKGDRFVSEKDGSWWTIAFQTVKDAEEFQHAVSLLQKAQHPGLENLNKDQHGQAWKAPDGKALGVFRRGDRTYVLEAANVKAFRHMQDRAFGPPQLTILSQQGKNRLSLGQLVERLLAADLICVGESHDSELHHKVQLAIIKGLHAHDESLGVGMEMFQRPFQKELDAFIQGKLDEAAFLKNTEYQTRWGYDWGLYRPIAEFCRRNQVPLAALNAPKELTSRISKVGHAGLNTEEKTKLGDIDFHLKEHRTHWFERLAKMHGPKEVPADQKERSYQVMTVWDDYMAASAAAFQKERDLRRLVVVAGSGHIDRGFGIPLRAARRTGGTALTVKIEHGDPPAEGPKEWVTDYVVYVK